MTLSPPLIRMLDRVSRSFCFPGYAFWMLSSAYASQLLSCLAYSLDAMGPQVFGSLCALNLPFIALSWVAFAWRKGLFTRGML